MDDRKCKAPSCGLPLFGQGYCRGHYRRWRATGDAKEHIPVGRFYDATPEERFWAKVNKNGPMPQERPELGPCWVWTSAVESHGYAIFQVASRTTVRAHRYAYEISRGPIPRGLGLDHLCHTHTPSCEGGNSCPHRRCVNPNHLDPAANRTNTFRSQRAPAAINHRKTHCKRGHAFDEANTYISKRGHRHCRRCAAEQMARSRARRRAAEEADSVSPI